MSKFPLIGKNVLVIYGDQKDHYKKLNVASGILVSIDALTNDKKEAKPEVTLNLSGVTQKIDGVLLVTLYSKKLQEQEKKQTPPLVQSNSPPVINLSVDDIQVYLKSKDASDHINVYQFLKQADDTWKTVEFKVPDKYFKLLKLELINMKATFQLLYWDINKAKSNSKKETRTVDGIFALYNPRDLMAISGGKLFKKKYVKTKTKTRSSRLKKHKKNRKTKRHYYK
jgi:hypothetical protein